jgi:AcrR family transcriptional regulator
MADMTPSTPAPRGRPRSARAQQAILGAAHELMREEGYRALTIEGIAARAGVGKQTIYRWWPSKGAILVDAFLAQLQTHATWIETGDFRADLVTAISRAATTLADPEFGSPYAALFYEALSDPAVAATLYQQVLLPSRIAHRERMVRAQAEGTVRTDLDVDLVIDMIYAPIWYRFFTRAVPLSDLDPHALGDAVLRAIQPATGDGARG